MLNVARGICGLLLGLTLVAGSLVVAEPAVALSACTSSSNFQNLGGYTSALPSIGSGTYDVNCELWQGTSGDGVRALQRDLNACYLAPNGKTLLTVDGDFGALTKDAVKYAQTKAGLTDIDGYYGPNTRKALLWVQSGSTSYSTCRLVAAIPAKTNGLTKPVYLIHGYSDLGQGFNAKGAYWDNAIADFLTDSNPAILTGKIWTWCYYSNDTNCDLLSIGDRSKPIKTLGQELAWDIYDRYSRYGTAVDVVGHSMGGLIIRAALTGVQKRESGFPPYLFVEDVATLSTPHRGVLAGYACSVTGAPQQCQDMKANSSFMTWLYDNPQGASGTDWTVIGFDDDLVVPAWSGAPDDMTSVGHRVIYHDGQITPQISTHMDLLEKTSGAFDYWYCDYWSSCASSGRSSYPYVNDYFDPMKMVRYALYHYNSY